MLLIGGAPASGKTRLARALLGASHDCVGLSKDDFKEVLFDHLGETDAAGSRRLSDASFALMFALAPRLLQAGRLLVLEGNFRPGEHEPALQALWVDTPVHCAQVLCVADHATRAARLIQRGRDPRRHPGHRDGEAQAGDNAAFLDLPGERWGFAGDGDWDEEWSRLRGQIGRWRAGG